MEKRKTKIPSTDERRNDRVRQAHNGPNQYKEIQGEIEEDSRTEKKQRTEPRRREETSTNKPDMKPPDVTYAKGGHRSKNKTNEMRMKKKRKEKR